MILPTGRRIKHGLARSAEYQCWQNLRRRCFDKNYAHYQDYGGRGITVCKRWNESFVQFYEDMGSRPSALHSVDRLNNDGDYCPENCRWATQKEQSRNRGNNKFLSYNGERLCISEWAERLGISKKTLSTRLRLGWSVEKTLITPAKKQNRKAEKKP